MKLGVLAGLTFLHILVCNPTSYPIAPLLKCFLEQDFHGAFTIIIPYLRPRRFLWALLQSLAVDQVLLGRKK